MSDLIVFQRVKETLDAFAENLVESYKDNLTDTNRNASMRLFNSVRSEVTVNGSTYEILLNLEEWWKYIEYGTKAHFPPVDKILEWVRVKPVLPYPMDNGRLPTEEDLAWMIAKKISTDGTASSHNLEHTLEALVGFWEEKIEEALDADILDCFDRVWALLES